MKIKNVKFYQAVTVHDGERYRTLTRINLQHPEVGIELEMTTIEGIGVLVKSGHGATVIPFNNVAFFHPLEESVVAPKSTKK